MNYSTNDATYELNCFLRVFFLKQFFIMNTKYPSVFHIDSDCIILENVDSIFHNNNKNNKNVSIAYSLQTHCQSRNMFHMVGSIHNALLNIDFCDAFIQLCFDIYKTKTKFHLIEPKINWHTIKKIGGGICDMTLYYLLYASALLNNIRDLNNPITLHDEPCVFDHQFSSSYGYLGENTFLKTTNRNKKLMTRDDKYYLCTTQNTVVRLLSIHYQGHNKQLLANDHLTLI